MVNLPLPRSEERRVGKSVDLGGRRIIKKNFFQAEDGILDSDSWLEFRRVLFPISTTLGLADSYKREQASL